MPRTSDDEPALLYEELIDDLLIDPVKVSAEIATGLAECLELLTNRLASGRPETSQENFQETSEPRES